MKYIITPKYCVACIGKAGSSSVIRAILHQFYADRIPVLVGADNSHKPAGWGRSRVDRTDTPDKPVVALVRDPIARFISACAQTGNISESQIDSILTSLETNSVFSKNVHFRQVQDFLTEDAILFLFPKQLKEFCTIVDLPELSTINDGRYNPPKPDLTPEQEARVRAYYAEDIELYQAL